MHDEALESGELRGIHPDAYGEWPVYVGSEHSQYIPLEDFLAKYL